jgi:uncharacterized delta-60 repeat protein
MIACHKLRFSLLTILFLFVLPGCNREDEDLPDWIYSEDELNCVVLTSDGKIIVAGTTSNNDDIVIMQLNHNGSVDSSFGNYGITVLNISVRDNVNSIEIYDDNKFDLLTTTDIYGIVYYKLVRFLPDGNIDNTFGDGGMTASMEGNYVSIQKNSNQSIVIGGTSNPGQTGPDLDFMVTQYNASGTSDLNFNNGSPVTVDFGYLADKGCDIAVQADDKILISGYLTNTYPVFDFAIARINPDGSPDTTFGNNGMVITDLDDSRDYARCMVIQPDGKILVCGDTGKDDLFDDIAIVKYNQDGSPDQNFGSGGIAIINAENANNSVCNIGIQADGKIILTGSTIEVDPDTNDKESWGFLLMRLNVDGSLDNNFGINGRVVTDINGHNGYAHSSIIAPDGKIVVVGKTTIKDSVNYLNIDFAIARYLSDGSPDNSFGENGIVTFDASDLLFYQPEHFNKIDQLQRNCRDQAHGDHQ